MNSEDCFQLFNLKEVFYWITVDVLWFCNLHLNFQNLNYINFYDRMFFFRQNYASNFFDAIQHADACSRVYKMRKLTVNWKEKRLLKVNDLFLDFVNTIALTCKAIESIFSFT